MSLLASSVPSDLSTGWWIALGVGLVVALVLTALLHTLLRQVKALEDAFSAGWEMGKQVARNTSTTWMLGQTARLADEVKEEALEHDAFLASKGG